MNMESMNIPSIIFISLYIFTSTSVVSASVNMDSTMNFPLDSTKLFVRDITGISVEILQENL